MYANAHGFAVQVVGTLINLDDAPSQHVILYPPCPITIVQFGMVVTEAFATSVGDFVLKLQHHAAGEWNNPSPGNGVDIATITPTVASGAAIGNVIVYTGTALPFQVHARRIITTTHVDGGVVVAGSVRPFVVYRVDGLYDPKFEASNVFGFAA